jgi:hypothetical protein
MLRYMVKHAEVYAIAVKDKRTLTGIAARKAGIPIQGMTA